MLYKMLAVLWIISARHKRGLRQQLSV